LSHVRRAGGDERVTRRLLVLVNPAAGGGRSVRRLPQVTAELGRLGAMYRVVHTRDIEHAREEAAHAAEAGETVVAVGGDGLLRPLAEVLSDTDASLAIVPAGRGNDLARVLGIPTDPTAAAAVAAQGEERMIDVAAVDGVSYLGIASFGFDSDANRVANEARLMRGNLVYLYAALRALATWKPAAFTVTVDGERHELEGYSVGACNSKAYGGGMWAAPHAELDDGQLDVVACGRSSKAHFLFSILPGIFKGTYLSDPSVQTMRGSIIEMDADRPFAIYADGDPIGTVPATITVRPRCLRMIVPE
jgi:YegS/Rv2252/BmrU family lipid kinase